MNKYYSLSPCNKGEMQNLISPIFELVRKNKIHSFNQLQKREDIDSSTNLETNQASYIFEPKPKTAQISPNSRLSQFAMTKERFTHYSIYSPQQNTQPKTPSIQHTKINETIIVPELAESRQDSLNKKSQSQPRKERKKMFRVNSKIKKHLVQEIDFDQIQKMFYKKRNAITRYEHFLNSKKQDKGEEKTNFKVTGRDKNKIIFDKYGDQIGETHETNKPLSKQWMTMPLKCPNRKKFWVKQYSKRQVKNSEYPRIEGTAFKTINL